MSGLSRIAELALEEIRQKSRKKIYQRDAEAWMADVMGRRWWSRQAEIAVDVVGDGTGQTFTLVKSANGVGKALSLDTPLPTPTGWTTMGEVQPGDILLDETGEPTAVTFKSDVQYDDTYLVKFSDGAEIVASGPHQWNTLTQKVRGNISRRRHVLDWRDHWEESATLTTVDIADTLRPSNARNHAIPINRAIVGAGADLPVDPYILGAWLGDGASADASMTAGSHARFIVDEFAERGYELRHAPTSGVSGDLRFTFTHQNFMQDIRPLNLKNNKHIPDAYLRASVAQRWELLRGLMDTDGFVKPGSSTCGIDFTNEALARGTVELVRSLGVRISITAADSYLGSEKFGIRYRMVFNPQRSPFSKSCYKSDQFKLVGAQESRKTVRTVVSVERIDTVATACVQVDSPRSLYLASEWMIPTHNTRLGADLMTWAVSVHDPLDTSVLATANVFTQISQNAFKYITDNYSEAAARGFFLPGRVVSDPAVRFDRGPGLMPKDIIMGRRPADKNLISSFQGTHDGFVFVLMDEAGGLPEDLWIGANAVTTNAHTAILAIGNPDELNTGFHRRFSNEDDKYSQWKRHTISAFDTPNFTGEIIYPDDLERDKLVKTYMIQPDWADRMKREAHPNVYLAKVEGEFPKDSTSSFFTQAAITTAGNTDIDPTDDDIRRLGVDLAFAGEDDTCFYLNEGGRIRFLESYNGEADYMVQAENVHAMALKHGVDEVNVDASGPGAGVYSLLKTQPQFASAPYDLYGFQGGKGSLDIGAWAQARSWSYDMFRRAMQMGEIDLDITVDTKLRDQMSAQTFKLNARRAIQITPKDEMRKAGLKSPDNLDSAILAFIDLYGYGEDDERAGGLSKGDVVLRDPLEIMGLMSVDGGGFPL